MKKFKQASLLLAVFLLGALTTFPIYYAFSDLKYIAFKNEIINNFDGEIDQAKFEEATFKGMVSGLGDPNSEYFTREELDAFSKRLATNYKGVGIQIGKNETNEIIITGVTIGSPAEKAGVLPGDIIKAVNDKELVPETTTQEVVEMVKAKDTAKIKLKNPINGKEMDKNITLTDIANESIYGKMLDDNGKKVGLIKIFDFSENTAEEFAKELTKLEADGMEALIIDVRDNGGGYLATVQSIIDQIVPNTKPAVTTKSKGKVTDQYTSKLTEAKKYPIALLQNENSASASEILSGALLEINKSAIVGTKSYGKGSVQSQFNAPNGGTLKMTMAHWYTPDDNLIDKKGIEPTVKVDKSIRYGDQLPISKIYQEGDSDLVVQAINNDLYALGYTVTADSDKFDAQTTAAVKSFQESNGETATGKVDQKILMILANKAKYEGLNSKSDSYIKAALEQFK
ncbi:MAG: S41 family peptidase [Mycoplasmatales bacterium]